MKCLKTLFLSAVLAAALSTLAVTTAAAGAGATAGVVSTATSPLTVRSAASTQASVAAKLPKGGTVTLISKSGDWWYVEYAADRYGYCHASYITPLSQSRAGYVSTQSGPLNIRTGGSTASAVAAQLPKGTGLVILSEQDGWSRVLYNGTATGYASSQYLSGYAQNTTVAYKAIALSVPDYKQYDSRWASLKVAGTGKTLSAIGCTTTAIADLESYRQGSGAVTPATMLYRLSYNASGDVYWPNDYAAYTGADYLSVLYRQLSAGKPVILGAKTSAGRMHWVVVKGYTGGSTLTASGFLINDPGSGDRTTLATLLWEYPYFYKLEYYN